MTVAMLDREWMTRALCRSNALDAEVWFPDSRGEDSEAVAICRRCPVARQCLEHALRLEPPQATGRERFGIFGGLTPAQRAQVAACRAGRCDHWQHRARRWR